MAFVVGNGIVGQSSSPTHDLFSRIGYLGSVKMMTIVPSIKIGGANLQLTTPPQSSLEALLNASKVGFPIVQQFNGFDAATMAVTLAP